MQFSFEICTTHSFGGDSDWKGAGSASLLCALRQVSGAAHKVKTGREMLSVGPETDINYRVLKKTKRMQVTNNKKANFTIPAIN